MVWSMIVATAFFSLLIFSAKVIAVNPLTIFPDLDNETKSMLKKYGLYGGMICMVIGLY